MAIELITPAPQSTILTGAKVSFDVDNTYTSLVIAVDTSAGFVTAYDTGSGGVQSGYSVSALDDGAQHTFTVGRNLGWDVNPVTIRVTENESGDDEVTEYNYDIEGNRPFPPPRRPYDPDDPQTLDLFSRGDADELFTEVEWVDVVSGPGVDGLAATSPEEQHITLTALASTTDPDAIHGNVGGEVDAIDEKPVAVGTGALLVIEDAEADGAKKKMETDALIAVVVPKKLDPDFDGQLLYLFDGDLVNSGIAGSTYDLTFSSGIRYTNAIELGRKAIDIGSTTADANTGSLSPSAAVSASGECTVQCVVRVYNDVLQTTINPQLFRLQSQNSRFIRTSWSLGFESFAVGDPPIPRFFYRNATDSATISLAATGFALMQGEYHLVGRRMSDGAGLYDLSIWVNGMKVAQLDSQVEAWSGGGLQQVKVGKDEAGIFFSVGDSFKQSNAALSDEDIVVEYKKTLGIS